MTKLLRSFWVEDEAGQGLAEYALIIGLVAIGAIVAVTLFGGRIADMFNNSAAALPDGTVPASE
jgi:pilus assembly protein Flp/PilA